MMKRNILFLFYFLLPILGCAQVQYDVEPQVDAAVEKHIAAWDKVAKIDIYCIQISSLSGEGSGTRAQEVVSSLNQLFISNGLAARAYSIFTQPNHKVRVGNFLTKREAYKVMSFLLPDYPGAFITRDKRKVDEWTKE